MSCTYLYISSTNYELSSQWIDIYGRSSFLCNDVFILRHVILKISPSLRLIRRTRWTCTYTSSSNMVRIYILIELSRWYCCIKYIYTYCIWGICIYIYYSWLRYLFAFVFHRQNVRKITFGPIHRGQDVSVDSWYAEFMEWATEPTQVWPQKQDVQTRFLLKAICVEFLEKNNPKKDTCCKKKQWKQKK